MARFLKRGMDATEIKAADAKVQKTVEVPQVEFVDQERQQRHGRRRQRGREPGGDCR